MLEDIEKKRKMALDVLKPSAHDLEHGLELHRSSLVWDAYGFAPGGTLPVELMHRIVDSGMGRDEKIDLLEQTRQVDSFKDPDMWAEAVEAWNAAGVDCIFQNAGVEGNAINQLIKRLSRFTWMADKHSGHFKRAPFPENVQKAREEGLHSLYLTTNGVPLPDSQSSVEEALYYFTVFFQLGVRMMHLTYNRRNLIGDGCAETSDAGLSDFGRAVVAEMNRVGVIPDISHSGQRTSLEAARASGKPVVASHSVAGVLSSHYRAKGDAVVKALADSGGYIGVCAISSLPYGLWKNRCAIGPCGISREKIWRRPCCHWLGWRTPVRTAACLYPNAEAQAHL